MKTIILNSELIHNIIVQCMDNHIIQIIFLENNICDEKFSPALLFQKYYQYSSKSNEFLF